MRTALIAWMPVEALPLVVAAAGVAVIFGARTLAKGLVVAALAALVLPVLLAPLFEALPTWLLYALVAVALLGLLAALGRAVMGSNAWDHMVGALAAELVLATVRGTWQAASWALMLPLRALVRLLRRP